MPDGQVLEFSGVTKRFGPVIAVSEFSARVEPGVVTGFLGPNGAGKTTSLRVLLGLVRATEGTATIGGLPYAKLADPLRTVGAALEASSFHPGRTAANHLKVYAQAAGLPTSRVDEAIGIVGLSDVAGRKVGGFSLGMRQRLGLAYTLLGDPGVLVLDEPANGLDPEGIKWMRGLLRQLAREGRTVLVSSHLLSEVQQTADALLVIAQGRLVFQGKLDELSDPSEQAVVVDSPDRAALSSALTRSGVSFEVLRSGFTVRGATPAEIGAVAAGAGVALSSLQKRGPALEEIFLDLVDGVRVHPSAGGAAPLVAGAAVAGAAVADAVADDAPVLEERPEADAETGEVPDAEAEEVADAETDEAADAEAEDVANAEDVIVDAPPVAAASTAGFAVASTGIIDVIPAGVLAADAHEDAAAEPDEDAEPAVDEPEPETEPEPEAEIPPTHDFEGEPPVVVEPALVVEPVEEQPAEPTWTEAPTENLVDEDAPTDDGDQASEEIATHEEDEESETPEEKSARLASDLEADRFFAAFDDSTGDASTGDDSTNDSSINAEHEANASEGHSEDTHTEHEGGEQR
ncbi:MAG TPA: ATP-binding cassette domain-containing protein [Microbacterium sp.]|uniref:ATP-binding cassette domain-containing protein n=1 Tax=Microbacterium sp. TaxID=51671 RepID=UPI002C858E7B|nr:ATP-binding cassette domain-containing protein [Microbacterium sp.]HWI32017.1 ATP-binding cassette domain-containing protein [Microbacterium sp.]